MFTLELTAWQDNEPDLRAVRTAVFIEEQSIPEEDEWDADRICHDHSNGIPPGPLVLGGVAAG